MYFTVDSTSKKRMYGAGAGGAILLLVIIIIVVCCIKRRRNTGKVLYLSGKRCKDTVTSACDKGF